MTHVDDALSANEVVLREELRGAVDDARARLAALIGPAVPSAEFLAALADELVRAVADPTSVPYPELADPDAYWNASVRPQLASLGDSAAEILAWLEERVIGIMGVAEGDLKAMVDRAGAEAGIDPAGTRAVLEDGVDRRCRELHDVLAEAVGMVPDAAGAIEARRWFDDGVRGQATADVESLRGAYLRDAGGDEAHQRFAEQQWSETFPERVAHREAMLRGEVPWRHMELALVGHERLHADLAARVETMVVRLQAPLRDMRGLLLERYDQMVASAG